MTEDQTPPLVLMERALKQGDEEAIMQLMLPAPDGVDLSSVFTGDGIKWLSALFSQDWFVKSEVPRFTFYWIEQEWSDIPESSRAQLLTIITVSYPKFEHWNSCFEACEALGDLYANEESYRALTSFAALDRDIYKAYVPHGLLHWCLKAKPSPDRLAAVLKTVEKLSHDPSELVREEVESALGKLKELQSR